MTVGYNGVPTIYKNIAFMGASVGELPMGPPGDSRAFDAITGHLLWTFHTRCRSRVKWPRNLAERWLERPLRHECLGLVYDGDEKTNTLYMPIGGPSPNYYGGDRPARICSEFDGRRRRQHRQVEMVFSDDPSRSVGSRICRRVPD